ncbi:RNA polymerase sigma factor [Sphingobacterium spiritivorum]|uniref:RNA polymerase sigma factor n=1 Tax=Sphingobacterium spiritivorum TaxID=258 RepID=UPI003DA4BE16
MQLILLIKQGDNFAFEEVYKKWYTKGFHFFLNKTKSRHDAEDLLQITFLRLWKYRNSISASYSIDQQLFYIARTVLVDHIRKANNHTELKRSISYHFELENLQNEQSTFFDKISRIKSILSTMPVIQKKIFELNRFEGYSYKEIAKQLSIKEKAVDNHLTKVLKQLRKQLT